MHRLTALGLALAALAAGVAGAEMDIKGPLPPMELERPGLPLRRLIAGGVAVGFVAIGAYFLWRRRLRHVAESSTDRPPLPAMPDLDDLETPEMYARLLDAVREALDGHLNPPSRTMTPRELAALDTPQTAAAPERWRAFCRRAEDAVYAGVPVREENREADREFVLKLLPALRAPVEAPTPDVGG